AACGGGSSAIVIDPLEDELAGTSDYYGTVEITASQDAYNFLTGTNDMASDMVGLRPYAISVNNIIDCWPQYGLSDADIIYEMETEGGITRMMALFMDTRETPLIGSVRSLRDQFMEAVFPLNPIIVHIGTSIYADKAVAENNFRTIDGNNLPQVIFVMQSRLSTYAVEHTKFTSGQLIDETLPAARISRELTTNVESAFNFVTEGETTVPTTGDAATVKYSFSSYGDGDFRYDAETGKYYKWQYGRQQVDAVDTGEEEVPLSFDNVFVIFVPVSQIEGTALVQMDYDAGGDAYYFSQGRYEKCTWSKNGYSNNFVFLTESGEELQVNTGNTHVGVVDVDREDQLVIS
ncbi:MAG: DUF3048 domain-containing protein, partial [Oscillospiraceae bacterium]|nr:DUF3048 domain-containing protein [Oscillospiraceae bacterium]